MTLDLKHPQTPDKTLVIILGASEWPEASDFTSSQAFAIAARSVWNYFRDDFKVPEDNLLWLFDKSFLAQEMDMKISKFLKEHAEKANHVIIYCIGHGQITSKGDGLYLPIRKTQQHNPEYSSLNVEALMTTIRASALRLKRIYILDCCFAGKAFPFLQNNGVDPNRTEDLLRQTLRHANRAEGYAALFASGPNNSAILLPDESNTFFTKAFLQVVTDTTAFLSLLDVNERMNACMEDLFRMYAQTHNDVELPPFPQIYKSEVALLPLFPSAIIQTDQLIIDIAKCLAQTPYREIRAIYCDSPTRAVRVFCSRFQGEQDFHHIFQQIEETTGWRIKVDVWEELAPLFTRPTMFLPNEKGDVDLHRGNGERVQRKPTNEPKLAEEESNRFVPDFKRTAEKLLNRIGKSLQSSHYQHQQNHFQIIVPGLTEQQKLQLKLEFQQEHPGYTLGVAGHR